MKELDYPLDTKQILQNHKKIRKQLLKQENLIEKRIAILSGSTIGIIKNILELFLLNNQIKPYFWVGNYNCFYEDIMFENMELINFKPDIIYIHTTSRNLRIPNIDNYDEELNELINKYQDMWNKIEKLYNCIIIQNNFEMLPYRIIGNYSAYSDSGNLNFIRLLNNKLYDYAISKKNIIIHDINYLSAWFGLEKWFDPNLWYSYKYAMSMNAIPSLCFNLANIIKAIYGKNKKALILDLDNTLWGGIIGDDGIEKIQIGNGTPLGMLYMDFQRYIKQLGKYGILLNICSKNEEKSAKEGLAHSEGILREEDFLIIKANWLDKHENVKSIIKELNILDDSVVFIDDNPAERDEVKFFLPHIKILDVTSPEQFITYLDHSGFFEVISYSKEDKERYKYYKDNISRGKSRNLYIDYNDYLISLKMKCFIKRINSYNYERVTQLINKTNQFNFTSIRYTENEMKELLTKESYITITSRLVDKYGDNGLVSTLIATVYGEEANINLWVMSCRVFKRNLEYTMFDVFIEECKKRNIQWINGYYRPTNKNNQIKNFFETLGFELFSTSEKEDWWKYEIPNNYIYKNTVMEVIIDG